MSICRIRRLSLFVFDIAIRIGCGQIVQSQGGHCSSISTESDVIFRMTVLRAPPISTGQPYLNSSHASSSISPVRFVSRTAAPPSTDILLNLLADANPSQCPSGERMAGSRLRWPEESWPWADARPSGEELWRATEQHWHACCNDMHCRIRRTCLRCDSSSARRISVHIPEQKNKIRHSE